MIGSLETIDASFCCCCCCSPPTPTFLGTELIRGGATVTVFVFASESTSGFLWLKKSVSTLSRVPPSTLVSKVVVPNVCILPGPNPPTLPVLLRMLDFFVINCFMLLLVVLLSVEYEDSVVSVFAFFVFAPLPLSPPPPTAVDTVKLFFPFMQSSQTRTGTKPYSSCSTILLLLQSPHTTSPHFRQWCFLFLNVVNAFAQSVQFLLFWSLFHKGAATTAPISGSPAALRLDMMQPDSSATHSSLSNPYVHSTLKLFSLLIISKEVSSAPFRTWTESKFKQR